MTERPGLLGRLGVIMAATRRGSSAMVVGAALATVAFATGFISYTHICALTLASRGSWKTAHLMPLAVDGQIVIGSVYFMENAGRRRRWLGLVGIVPGVAESLYANWQSAAGFGWHDQLWATVPAQAFACSTVLFERWLHNRKAARALAGAAESVLAATRAENDGLREALEAARQLADAHLARAEAAVASAARPRPAPAAPVPALPAWMLAGKTVGPADPLPPPARPKAARPRPALVPPLPGDRKALPADPRELAALVNSTSRNGLVRAYQVTSHKADQLRAQYLETEGGERVA